MSEQELIQNTMKLALVTIMFTMGLQLTLNDFKRVIREWRSVALGVIAQIVLLPLLALLIIMAAAPGQYVAVGLFLVAICPGGPLSNFFAHIGGGNGALSVSTTATTTLISLVTLPLVITLGVGLGIGLPLDPPRDFILKSLVVGLVIPITLGLVVNTVAPGVAQKAAQPLNKLGMLLILVVLALIAYLFKDVYTDMQPSMLWSGLLLNVLGMVVGYGLPRLMRAPRSHSVTFAFEVGIQNVPLATLLGYGLIEHTLPGDEIALALVLGVIGLYAIISVINAWVAVFIFKRGKSTSINPLTSIRRSFQK